MTSIMESQAAEVVLNPNGLTFVRRNTSDSAGPFDRFTWGPRDVVMRNWRDGSINFEQRGVDFPVFWSDNAVAIVTSKYFRGALGSEQREHSLRDVVNRVVNAYRDEGLRHGYFRTEKDAEVFADELKYALVDQQFSFNSPVWFNVGTSSPWQVSACYILSVDDSMESILNWYREEGLIFKGGSGAGVNLSALRSSKELLSSGGAASGPVSFMRGADASAGTIKSGGATRRAAKMVILDVDHPDIEEFIATKAREEKKIRVLRDAGFDMDLGGADAVSVQYQNANNSVRVNDEFMNAVRDNGDFSLVARSTGEPIESVSAREVFRSMAEAAWECGDPGIQYDGQIQRWHTLPGEGRISATNPCSEFVHLDNSSCNLASIKMTKFYDPESQSFDLEGYRYLVRLIMTAAEISVAFGHFPTPEIGEVTRKARPIGLGYTDLGAMLMSAGLAYDSDEGRAFAGAVTSLLTAEAYRTSTELAKAVGSFEYFEANRGSMLGVLQRHYDSSVREMSACPSGPVGPVFTEATAVWRETLQAARVDGVRNAQATVIAPTGTISFFMDATTTGIEPDLALVKYKKIADGSSVTIVNETVPVALRALGYAESDIEAISEHVRETGSILSAPGFDAADAPVFACAMGDNVISPMGHVRMMAAVQPFVSGAISKTVNMPEDSTVEDIEEVYFKGWELGLKALAIYRDNCKVGQPLSAAGSSTEDKKEEAASAPVSGVVHEASAPPAPVRHRLPRKRSASTTSFTVGGADGYVIAGAFEDGRMGELFLKMSKPGSTLAGVMDAFAISVSLGLQYGVPLETYCAKLLNMRFEPAGMTDDPDVRFASSVMDYVFRRLALDFLPREVREQFGVLSTAERAEALDAGYTVPASATAISGDVLPEAADVSAAEHRDKSVRSAVDSPLCYTCGVEMVRAGSCFACPQCAATSGCS